MGLTYFFFGILNDGDFGVLNDGDFGVLVDCEFGILVDCEFGILVDCEPTGTNDGELFACNLLYQSNVSDFELVDGFIDDT